jgi:hypothetical protein
VEHVPNPLPREPHEDDTGYEKRLENAVGNLNRRLPAGTLHFRVTHDRKGVRWEYAPAPAPRHKPRPRKR